MILRKFENLLKSISDDAQTSPEGHGMNLGTSWKLDFLRSGPDRMCMDPRWCVWSLYVWSGDMVCLLVWEEDVFLWDKNMSCCWRRLYGYGRCLVEEDYMDMEDVFLLEKNIWLSKMSSCWRIYASLTRNIYIYSRYEIGWYDMI